ncbi:ubiquitin-conjugating enzyme E2C-binding protein [Xylariaceae sp. AK1471]|nr:ubiquitin-conjugating enzyme E2C-binding protein [Xylariaceae sp. AK1471]
MPSSQRILIYAELLSNIRQVSVGCTLPTPVSTTTRATVAADGKVLTVAHDGLSQSLQLPGVVASSSQLPVKSLGDTRLSWRLPLAALSTSRVLPTSEESVPWSATDLEQGSAVVCRTCKSTIVEAGTLQVWKDLPSENWAEMMEFWHCHKPQEHKHSNDDQHLTNRGYGASSRIAAQPGVGFVDLTSFLLADSDVIESSILASAVTNKAGNEDNESNETALFTSNILHCSSCKTQLGVRNDEASSISLFKWQVLVKQLNRNTSELSPTLAQCVSAMLLATMARSGCSKSILIPMKAQSGLSKSEDPRQSRGLQNIWVFNSNITFSSTEAPTSPVNAVKVFYRVVSQEEADKMLEAMTSDVQDILLPSEAITTIDELLNMSNGFVPESDRKFKEWTVGLLEKWNGKGG